MNNSHSRPLAIDLFTGLHGWSEGLVAEGWRVVGFDLEDMCGQFGQPRPEHVQLVIQNVLTLHGSQFRNADLIVASPPCQKYSWMAMPWSRAKAKAAAIRADETGTELAELNALFNACFRIQREACEAAGRHIPMVVENVKGAQPWVGRARWSFGSFYLWGDVPALMPSVYKATKVKGFSFDGNGGSFQSAAVAHTRHLTNPGEHITRDDDRGVKVSGGWFGSYAEQKARGSISPGRMHDKGSPKRKMASAMIAKIPLPLSRWIAATYRPKIAEAAE